MERLVAVEIVVITIVLFATCADAFNFTGTWTGWGRWSPCSRTCDNGSKMRTRLCTVEGKCTGNDRETMPCNDGPCIGPSTPGPSAQWLQWGQWSPCNPTCDFGQRTRSRRCSQPGQCIGQRTQTDTCRNIPPCPGAEGWGPWGPWSPCSPTCGPFSQRSRNRVCSTPGRCPGDRTDTAQCQVPPCGPLQGDWSQWEAWSPCSPTCGPFSQRSRNRVCSRPGTCPGESSDTAQCQVPTCGPLQGDWSQWEAWSPCSPTCGPFSQRSRSRVCSRPGTCQGQSTDTAQCQVPPCGPLQGDWSQWEAWSPCSPTCGPFSQRSRNRVCSRPGTCQGQSTETTQCQVPPCGPVQGDWSPWGPWSPCSPTCDFGQRSRNRRCSVPGTCPGRATENTDCNVPPCPQPANWGPWGPWSPCSPTCDFGQRARNRNCSVPYTIDPNACPGLSMETANCQVPPCPQPANWGPWGPWSPCSPSCGTFGQRSRNRVCDTPGQCSGERSQTDRCSVPQCQGDWSPWGPWSPCSPTCDFGQRSRNRRCSIPGTCQGVPNETTDCNVPPCQQPANWGPWGPWSPCTPTCGTFSQRSRNRFCEIPGQCPGDRTETDTCSVPQCGGTWTPWGPWTPCNPTCDFGSRSRNRRCTIPGTCQGSSSEMTDCTVPPCPQPVNWGPWGPWSPCSPSCGAQSQRTRTRFCSVPGQCPGDRTGTESCPVPTCPPLADWSQWSQWSQCNPTCDFGQRARTRFCTAPGQCQGQRTENENCPVPACPPLASWQPWGQWSPCNPTCDFGQRMRNRRCNLPGQCQGQSTENENCPVPACPPLASWQPWGPWTPCNPTCDFGQRMRNRQCNLPGQCQGQDRENENCPVPPCPTRPPVTWQPWGSWGPCSATCGFGEMVRTRQCSSPSPAPGDCLGPPAESQDCSQRPCAQWLDWGAWAQCSATCGLGQRTRNRRCSVPGQCVGMMSQMEICNAMACLKWSDWGPWTMCSSSCGPGMEGRARACPKDGRCPGQANEMGLCNVGPCPFLSDWTTWSDCTTSCGKGNRRRRKVCNSARGCDGLVEERGVCHEKKTCRTLKEFIDLVTKKKEEFTGLISPKDLQDVQIFENKFTALSIVHTGNFGEE